MFPKNSEKNVETPSTGGHKKLHHHVITHVQKHKVKWLAVLFGAIIVLLVYMFVTSVNIAVAKQGDNVKVNYVGTLDNGSVFDTSLEAVAKTTKDYNPSRKYEPLQFSIGGGQVLPDFENAVIGMKVGETKKIKILAVNGYPINPQMIVGDIPIDMILKTSYDTPLNSFETAIGAKAEIGKEFTLPNSPLKIKITAFNAENVTFAPIATIGQKVQMPFREWSAVVSSVDSENITLKRDVKIDQRISVNGQVGRVVDVNDKVFKLDLNLPIAGKDLNFEISLVEIVKV